jgi:hypothetical protein
MDENMKSDNLWLEPGLKMEKCSARKVKNGKKKVTQFIGDRTEH